MYFFKFQNCELRYKKIAFIQHQIAYLAAKGWMTAEKRVLLIIRDFLFRNIE